MSASEEGNDTHLVVCPCCSTKLTLDAASGEILHEDRPKKKGLSWDAALQAGADKQAEAERLFEKGIDRVKHGDDLLEKKFREALKRADKSDTPPKRIFDLD